MISKIFKEHNDSDSIFIYLPDFLLKHEQDGLVRWMNSMDDFQECENFQSNGISRYQKWYQKKW